MLLSPLNTETIGNLYNGWKHDRKHVLQWSNKGDNGRPLWIGCITPK